MRPTSVYIIEAGGKVKIGIAADVLARMDHLQMAGPVKLTLTHERRFATREGARLAERSLHAQFNNARAWGEWFAIDSADAVAALTAMDEVMPPVRIGARLRQAKRTTFWSRIKVDMPDRAPEPLPRSDRYGYTPSAADMDLMGEDAAVDHLRAAGAILDFTRPSDECRARAAEWDRWVAFTYGDADVKAKVLAETGGERPRRPDEERKTL